MDADTNTPTDARKSHLSRAAWLVPAVLLHLLMWLAACGYLYFLVPRYAAQLNDYGVQVSREALTVISLSDLLCSAWPVVAVFVTAVVIGVDCLIVCLTRSRKVRTALLALFLVPPLAWYVSCYLTMSQAMTPITRIPYGG